MILGINDRMKSLRARRDDEAGAALVYAILTLIILVMATILITSAAINQANSATRVVARDLRVATAEQGLDSFLSYLNSTPGESMRALVQIERSALNPQEPGPHQVKGYLDGKASSGYQYSLSSQQVLLNNRQIAWLVYARSNQVGSAAVIEMRSLYTPRNVGSGGYVQYGGNHTLTYSPPERAAWQFGLTGYQSVNIGVSPTNTGSLTVADSNLLIGKPTPDSVNNNLPAYAATNGVASLYSTSASTYPDLISYSGDQVCNASGNCRSFAGQVSRGYVISPAEYTQKATSPANTASATSPCRPTAIRPAWVASAQPGNIINLVDGACYESITFDKNMNVPTSSNGSVSKTAPYAVSATNVYVRGNVTVNPGIQVNAFNKPGAFRIISQNGNLNVSGNNTYAGFYYATGAGNCTISGTTTTMMFGALSCSNVTVQNGAQMVIDLQSYNLYGGTWGGIPAVGDPTVRSFYQSPPADSNILFERGVTEEVQR